MRATTRLLLIPLTWLAAPCCDATDLLTAYHRALAHDARYLSAQAGAGAERREVSMAVAGLLPTLGFSGTVSRNDTWTTLKGFFGDDVATRSLYYSESYSLLLRQPLYRKQNWAQFRQAQALASGAQATLLQERQALALRVAGAYFDALLAGAQLRTESTRKATFEKTLALSQKAFDTGAGTLVDVYEVQARRDLAGAFEIEAENGLQDALMTLRSLMDQEPGPLAAIDSTKLPSHEGGPGLEEILQRAVAANPVLSSLRFELAAAKQELERARSGHYPTLDLIAAHRRASNELESTLDRGTRTSLVGLQVSLPLFSGGYTRASVLQARDQLEAARQKFAAGRREIELNVRRESANMRHSASKVAAFEQAVASSEKALAGTEKGVSAGTRTTLDVLNAQDQLFKARAELARASCQFAMSFLKFREAAGSLDDDAIQTVNAWLEG